MQITWTEIPSVRLTHLVRARDDGDVIFQYKLEVRLQHLVELVGVGEENDGTAGLGEAAGEPHNPVPDESLAVLDVDTQLRWLLPPAGGQRGRPGAWP